MKSPFSEELSSLHTLLLFFLFTIFSTTSVSYEVSYSDHCSSTVPEATPTAIPHNVYPLIRPGLSYYSGGDRIVDQYSDKTFSFRTTQNVYQTNVNGVYKFAAYLRFRSSSMYYIPRNSTFGHSNYFQWNSNHGRNSLRFLLSGFWSESSEKICMVGSAPWVSTGGKILNLGAVLKLHYARNSSISNSLVSGTLESLGSPEDLTYFEPISMLGFAQRNEYKYSLISGESSQACSGGIDFPPNLSLNLQPRGICSVLLSLQYTAFRLEYGTSNCSSSNNCASFGPLMSLYTIQCSEQEQKLRYLVKFPNTSYFNYREPFNPNTSLVGEGSWDAKKNRLCIVACRIASSTDDMGTSQLGDCSIRLSLRYPLVWSIKNSVSIEGQIWTNKTVNDSGYFNSIKFQSARNTRMVTSGVKYEYTEIKRARSSCSVEKKRVNKKGERYPDGHSSDMRFNMEIKNSKGNSTWGYAVPLSIGDNFYEDGTLIMSSYEEIEEVDSVPALEKNINYSNPLNISYKLSFVHGYPHGGVFILGLHSSPDGSVEVTAEGVYDAETGQLCLVGCRDLGPSTPKNDSMDCEILLSFQFPPVNGKGGNDIKGTMKSTRKEKDPLYFEQLSISSTSIYTIQAKRSIGWIWRSQWF